MPTVTTNTIGSAGDYTSIQAWNDAAPSDLVANDVIWEGVLLDTPWDEDGINIQGSTTDATRYKRLTVQDADRHFGLPGNGIHLSPSTNNNIFNIYNDFECTWLEISNWGDANNISAEAFEFYADVVLRVGYNLIHDAEQTQSDAIYWAITDGGELRAWNNIAYNIGRTFAWANVADGATVGPIYVKNNTLYNIFSQSDFTRKAGAISISDGNNTTHDLTGIDAHIYNNYIHHVGSGSLLAYYLAQDHGSPPNLNGSHNAANDGSASTASPGGSAIDNLAPSGEFQSLTGGSEDLHLAAGSTLVGAGVDLSGDATMPVTDDIDAEMRPQGSGWDVGADDRATATAPSLSNGSATPTGENTASGSVDTDTGEGTVWAVVTTVDAEPSASQIKSGQNANGSSAAGADSTSVSSSGTVNLSFTGLDDGQAHKVWFYQEDAGGTGSNVVSSGGIATDVGALASKAAEQFYPCVEWTKYVDPSEVGSSSNFDAIVDTTFTPNDGSNQTIGIQWYYDGSKFGKERFTVRFAGLDVDTYSISTSSTDISPLDGLSGSVTVSARTGAPKPLRFLQSDGDGVPAVRASDGTLEARDIRISHGQWSGKTMFSPFNDPLTSFWDGQESLYADNVVPRMNERNANMKYDHLGGQQIGGTDHDPPWSDENPHRNTFDVLDRLLDDVQSRGQDAFDFYLWLWLDGGRSDPGGFSGGYNGPQDERMQRYIAARLGPRVEVSYLAYGFDLQESASVSGSDLDTWAQNMEQWVDYPMLFSGRGYSAEDNGSSTTPQNPGNDDQGWIATNLNATALSSSTDGAGGPPSTDGMVTVAIHTAETNGVQDLIDYDHLANEVQQQSPSDLVVHEEGYLIGRDLSAGGLGGDHIWDSQANRRWFYRSRLALWVGGSMGDGGDGNYDAADFDALQTAGQFWDTYLTLGLVRDNGLAPDGSSWAVRESDNSRIIVYAEGTGSINVDLSSLSGTYAVTAVDTTSAYNEVDQGTVSGGGTRTVSPASSSDWALVLDETTDTTPPSLTNATAAADGTDGYSGSVDVDETGTLDHVVTTSSTQPTPAEVDNGQNHNGTTAAASGSQSVSSTGTQSIGQTGVLSSGTQYWVHYMAKDAAGNRSTVATAGPFTTDAATNPPNQPTATGATNIGETQADLQSSSYSEPDGDPHQSSDWQVRPNGASDWTSPVFESLDDTGNLESITATGLSAGTQYEYRVRHTDTDGDSAWSAASTFTTDTDTASIAFTGSNRVEDVDGNPVQGATVYATRVGASMQPLTATTDASGEATITGATAGETYHTWAEGSTSQLIIRTA